MCLSEDDLFFDMSNTSDGENENAWEPTWFLESKVGPNEVYIFIWYLASGGKLDSTAILSSMGFGIRLQIELQGRRVVNDNCFCPSF